MGVLRRKNQAEQDEAAWRENAPGEYESANRAGISAALGKLGTGFDWNTGDESYLALRGNAQRTAQDAADNAKAGAAALSGGYGTGWADSAAQQTQRESLAGIDNALTSLRAAALNEYTDRQNGLLNAIGAAQNTEALDQSARGLNFANWANVLNQKANASETARGENSSFWSGLWQNLVNAAGTAMDAYDWYKGYDRQKTSDQQAAVQQALAYKEAGADDAAAWVLQSAGLDSTILDGYTGKSTADQQTALAQALQYESSGAHEAAVWVLQSAGLDSTILDGYTGISRADKADALSTAASLAGAGATDAARQVLAMYGLDTGSLDDYSRLVAGSRYSTGSTGSTGSTTAGSWTNSQILSAADKYYDALESGDSEAANWYAAILSEAGYPAAAQSAAGSTAAGSTAASGTGVKNTSAQYPYTPASTALRSQTALTGTGKATGGTGSAGTQSAAGGTTAGSTGTGTAGITREEMYRQGYAYAAQARGKGLSDETIIGNLQNRGMSVEEIKDIMNRLK
ncbi:MAG: hypothetical protein ACI3WR_04975 [Oscillospiraceae bacterium]